MRAPGNMEAVVFSNTRGDHAVLKTLEILTGNDPVCPGSCGIDGKRCQTGWAAYLPASSLAKGQKSTSWPSLYRNLRTHSEAEGMGRGTPRAQIPFCPRRRGRMGPGDREIGMSQQRQGHMPISPRPATYLVVIQSPSPFALSSLSSMAHRLRPPAPSLSWEYPSAHSLNT
jgi:hypothetical protein